MKTAAILCDFGTTDTKCTLLIREENGFIHILDAIREHSEPEPPSGANEFKWKPRAFIERFVSMILRANVRAATENAAVRGICCTTTTTSTVAVKGRSIQEAVPALRWDDQRATAEAALLKYDLEEAGANREAPWMTTGPDSAVARAVWLASRYTEELRGTCLVEQLDLPPFLLTGRAFLSETIAARKWGFTRGAPWNESFHQAVKSRLDGAAEALLPLPENLVAAGESVGTIHPHFADQCGLSHLTEVITAPYDTVAGVLGLGILNEENAVTVSLGTSMGVCRLVSPGLKVPVSEYGPIPDMPFPKLGLLYEGLRSCGSAIELVNVMALGVPHTRSEEYYARIQACIKNSSPGSDGVLVIPYFNGGLRMRPAQMTEPAIIGFKHGLEEKLVRAVFEAVAYHIRLIIEKFEQLPNSRPIQIIRAGGGLTKNKEFMRLVASVTGRRVDTSSFPYSGLLGCAICAATGLRWFASPTAASKYLFSKVESFQPDPQHHKAYESLYRSYCDKLGTERGHYAPKQTTQASAARRVSARHITVGEPKKV